MRAADRIPTVQPKGGHARSETSPMQRMVLRAAVTARGIGPASPYARYWRVITELQRRGLLRRDGAILVITDAGREAI